MWIFDMTTVPAKIKSGKPARLSVQTVIKYIVFVLFVLYAVSLIFPFLWIFLGSFKQSAEFFNSVWALPKSLYFENYSKVITGTRIRGSVLGIFGRDINIFGMFINSITLVAAGVVANVFLSCCAAYVVAKYKFFGRNALFYIAVFFMVVPIIGGLPAQVRMMEALGINDSFIGILFLYSFAFGFNFIMMFGYFKNLSFSYAEAAYMDGASDFAIFGRIMLPLSFPPIVAISVLHFIGLWNDYATPFLFAPSMPTLSVGLFNLSEEFIGRTMYPALFASIIVAVLPVLILFGFTQKTIIENTVAGGLKG
jgi:raffinose/stachyose/melibiose transport system permease protein/N-acetylglucosamine transport system permease protein